MRNLIKRLFCKSSSTRRMWIEIKIIENRSLFSKSHPPHGGCGLKWAWRHSFRTSQLSSSTRRMWIEIFDPPSYRLDRRKSSSTRRMWIEIRRIATRNTYYVVILHTEDVDWNIPIPWYSNDFRRSSSTRRMWIEISSSRRMFWTISVILHTVDWNNDIGWTRSAKRLSFSNDSNDKVEIKD